MTPESQPPGDVPDSDHPSGGQEKLDPSSDAESSIDRPEAEGFGTAREDEAAEDSPPAGWYPDPAGGSQQRYWDGSHWTAQSASPTVGPALSTTKRSADERKGILSQQIQHAAVRGLRVESQSDFQAVLLEGQRVNHTLHAILTIFTCLLWGIVWAVIAATGGEHREMIVVDEFGNIHNQKLGKA